MVGILLQSNILEAFVVGFGTVSQPTNFLLIVLAVVFGLIMGVVPGLGGVVTIALLIPFTFGMEPVVAFMIMAAALGGTNFGGSITAILLNTPGQAPNAATLIDGYPMARDGRAGEAIGASATASALGAFFGTAVFILSIPVLLSLILLFGTPEVFWLAMWGLTVIAVVVKGDVALGLVSASFGILISLHGLNSATATVRWDYGVLFMESGFPLVPVLIGLFPLAEMIKIVSQGGTIAKDQSGATQKGGRWRGMKAVFEHKGLFLRSATIGAIIGVIPGVGGSAANYIAYFQAVQTSSDPDVFGTGDIRGVIAPEASNDAKDGTGFLPTLGLGVPGSASMAVLLGAFVLHGITPGPFLFQQNLPIVTTIILALLISNFLTSFIGIGAANYIVKITRIDVRLIAPIVISLSFFGTYALGNNIYHLFIALFFGLMGYAMVKVNMSRVPLILGVVLGPLVETNFFRALRISQGDYSIFYQSNLSIFLIVLTVVSLFFPIVRSKTRFL